MIKFSDFFTKKIHRCVKLSLINDYHYHELPIINKEEVVVYTEDNKNILAKVGDTVTKSYNETEYSQWVLSPKKIEAIII